MVVLVNFDDINSNKDRFDGLELITQSQVLKLL